MFLLSHILREKIFTATHQQTSVDQGPTTVFLREMKPFSRLPMCSKLLKEVYNAEIVRLCDCMILPCIPSSLCNVVSLVGYIFVLTFSNIGRLC